MSFDGHYVHEADRVKYMFLGSESLNSLIWSITLFMVNNVRRDSGFKTEVSGGKDWRLFILNLCSFFHTYCILFVILKTVGVVSFHQKGLSNY